MVHDIHHLITSAGSAGPVVFIVLGAAITLLFVPRSAGAIVAGAAFGQTAGAILTWTAMMVGAMIAFQIGRRARRARHRLDGLSTGRRREPITTAAAGIDHWLEHRGLLTVLGARVVPGMPFTTINYAAGFSKLRFWQFTAATALGVIPSTYLLATVGSAAHQPTSERFIIAAAAIAGASAAVAISGQTHRRRRNRTSPHAHGAPGRRR